MRKKIPLQILKDKVFQQAGVNASLLRLDSIHPGISGNKWYKLKYNLQEAISTGNDTILTFGGAFSNHIHATAIAAEEAGLNSIGVIRGERVEPLNPTLSDAVDHQMKLQFISREQYRLKDQKSFIEDLSSLHGEFYLIPEGGTNRLGIKGASLILDEISDDFDYVITAVGTGGTITGLICGLRGKKTVLGIPVLKGDFFAKQIENLIYDYRGNVAKNWLINNEYHFGGYGKFTNKLISFINGIRKGHGIQLDPIYTGKMIYALWDLTRKGYFPAGSRIVALHTGGLQGIRGFNERHGQLIDTN